MAAVSTTDKIARVDSPTGVERVPQSQYTSPLVGFWSRFRPELLNISHEETIAKRTPGD